MAGKILGFVEGQREAAEQCDALFPERPPRFMDIHRRFTVRFEGQISTARQEFERQHSRRSGDPPEARAAEELRWLRVELRSRIRMTRAVCQNWFPGLQRRLALPWEDIEGRLERAFE